MTVSGAPKPDRRRAMLGLAATLVAPGFARAAPFDLAYASGRLSWPGGSTRASAGKAGVRSNKREGDLATPQGDFRLLLGFFRPDRISPAPSGPLPFHPLTPADAWVDDPGDARYNTRVSLPYPAHVERLWRSDDIYDVVIVIGYNIAPPEPGAGSAIFLHLARKSYSPTVGCIAISRPAMLALIPRLSADSSIHIRP